MTEKKSSIWKPYLPYIMAIILFIIPSVTIAGNSISRNEGNNPSETIKMIKFKGKVVDAKTNTPLNSVSITIKSPYDGTIIDGTITFIDGSFEIDVPINSIVSMSYVGKQTLNFIATEEKINSLNKSPIRLNDDIIRMDEIVIERDWPKILPKPVKVIPDYEDDTGFFMIVEEKPEYPGGTDALMEYVKENIIYPADALNGGVQGCVIVQFTVNPDGSTSDFKIIRSVFPSLDKEAIRVLSQTGKWKPGRQRGRCIPVEFQVPVTFKLLLHKKK